MKTHLLLAALSLAAFACHGQSLNQYTIPLKTETTGPLTPKYWNKAANKLWGTDASGFPTNIDSTDQLLSIFTGATTGTGDLVFSGDAELFNPIIESPGITGMMVLPNDIRQSFNPGASFPGLNVGSEAFDPSSPANGDLWYNSATQQLKARINGATVALGAGGSGLDNVASAITGDTLALDGVLTSGQTWTVRDLSGTVAFLEDFDTAAELAGIVTEVTGEGNLVFASAPTLVNPVLSTPEIAGQMVLPDNTRQIFNPGTANAGINVGAHSVDPSAPSNGDVWYNSTSNQMKMRANSATIVLGAGVPSFGSGVDTWLGTPSSSNLATAVTGETGSGALVFGTSPTITTPTISGAVSWPDGTRQTFNPNGTSAGINVGAQAGDPSSLTNGDLWYNSIAGELRSYVNSETGPIPQAPTSATDNAIARWNEGRRKLQDSGVYINDSGQVGIGTSSPSAALQINAPLGSQGQLQIRDPSGAGSASTHLIEFRDSAGTRMAFIYKESVSNKFALVNEGAGGAFSLGTGGGDRLYIAYDGKVGVGTNTPAELLDVNGTVEADSYQISSSAVWRSGSGSPEGAVTAPVGSLYTRTDGGASTTLYVKESGSGNTGWVAK